MRLTIDLDPKAIEDLRTFSEGENPEEQVAAAIADWLRIKRQRQALHNLEGIGWDGDLEEMRNNWS